MGRRHAPTARVWRVKVRRGLGPAELRANDYELPRAVIFALLYAVQRRSWGSSRAGETAWLIVSVLGLYRMDLQSQPGPYRSDCRFSRRVSNRHEKFVDRLAPTGNSQKCLCSGCFRIGLVLTRTRIQTHAYVRVRRAAS